MIQKLQVEGWSQQLFCRGKKKKKEEEIKHDKILTKD
jgi:hypothetical protein